MKPEHNSYRLLSITRSKAKMYEYDIPIEHHIEIPRDPVNLLTLAVGLLGDLAAQINATSDIYPSDDFNIEFSARFFDAYFQSQLNVQLNNYILLMGATSYYLSDLPGSSTVLTRIMRRESMELDGAGLDDLLLDILRLNANENVQEIDNHTTDVVSQLIGNLSEVFFAYYNEGKEEDQLFISVNKLRDFYYQNGTPRQLLLADLVGATIRKRFENSVWSSLPKYSGLAVDDWRPVFEKQSFVTELWPAQHLLGEGKIFAGKSAVVQMPTSAGKTKSVEIIIRSAFLSKRASTAVIIAPFRALCHEIGANLKSVFSGENVLIDEFSDVLQVDLQQPQSSSENSIWIVTPEKFIYLLRQIPSLADQIGLIIYDEGHQFDSGIRGVIYELLLTTLKSLIPQDIQVILISAVINNAEQVKEWLIPEAEVISGSNLLPTFRTIAFTSWDDYRGRLEFVSPNQPNNKEFFVPRVIEAQRLENKGRETKERLFPQKNHSPSIALYLGLKLTKSGSIAIFFGTKRSVFSSTKTLVDAYERNLVLPKPIEFSDEEEVRKLTNLHALNLGEDTSIVKSSKLGVFTHHNNVPHGLRLAIEYALKENLIKFVLCTSTLAQGVNLPIRYLILSNIYQGRDRIKVRDFHNLIGRAGRSGIHTEGSIIFSDPTIFSDKDSWRWSMVIELLNSENTEPCLSSLLSLFDPLKSDDGKHSRAFSIIELIQLYTSGVQQIESFIEANTDDLFSAKSLTSQISYKIKIISAIESYLLANGYNSEDESDEIVSLANNTFAYYLGDNSQKDDLVQCFQILSNNIQQRIPESDRKNAFGRTMYGVWTTLDIQHWIEQNLNDLFEANTQEKLFKVIWDLLEKYIENSLIKKCEPKEVVLELALLWIQGFSFENILVKLQELEAKRVTEKRSYDFTIENVVDICENGFAYEGSLLIGAMIEILQLINTDTDKFETVLRNMKELQKRVKYGLSSMNTVAFYEIGFSDRAISFDLARLTDIRTLNREELIAQLRRHEVELRSYVEKYPSYFSYQLDIILSSINE